jgi:hypothetical protein
MQDSQFSCLARLGKACQLGGLVTFHFKLTREWIALRSG